MTGRILCLGDSLTYGFGLPRGLVWTALCAAQTGADGVHVGQEDLEAGRARELLGPDKLIGVSAHSVEEALAAQAAGADYLGVGAAFVTGTKTDANPGRPSGPSQRRWTSRWWPSAASAMTIFWS